MSNSASLSFKCSPVDFSQPVAFENAEIGRCPDVAPPPPPPAPEEEEEEKEEEEQGVTPPKLTPLPPPPSTVRPDWGIVGKKKKWWWPVGWRTAAENSSVCVGVCGRQ